MLYEMVTGDRPFQGDTSAELASSILRDTPAPVTERKADLPRDLGKLIRHCLEKEPTRRLQSVLDVRNELEELQREVDTGEALVSTGAPITARRADGKRRAWLVGGAVVAALALAVGYLMTRSPPERRPAETASAERKRLVVLPFENLGAPEDAYFAAGVTEEITSRLARVSDLGVISRTSAFQYDRAGKSVEQIGRDFGVGFVLEGSGSPTTPMCGPTATTGSWTTSSRFSPRSPRRWWASSASLCCQVSNEPSRPDPPRAWRPTRRTCAL
jgi:serine/threonine protein kinase